VCLCSSLLFLLLFYCLAFVDTSEGVKKFLLGRQLTVVILSFFISSLTHFVGLNDDSLPYGLYFFIVTAGLPGVMIHLQIAQLTPQLLAAQNNIAFINLPGSYMLAKWALFVESFGLVNVTWLIYFALDKLLCAGKPLSPAEYDQLNTSASPLFSLCYDSDDNDSNQSTNSARSDTVTSTKELQLTPNSISVGVEC
jgi:hypothetical protein